VSIVGIPFLVLVPFAVLLVILVMLIGFLGIAHHVGRRIIAKFGWTEAGTMAAVAIGVAIIGSITLLGKLAGLAGGFVLGVPVTALGYFLEYIAWTVGFGATILTWYDSRSRIPTVPASPAAPSPLPGEA
jgi:hypothetical protein